MEMIEFDKFKKLEDKSYPMVNFYELEPGKEFYIEPSFYTQLYYVKDHFADRFNEIVEETIDTVRRNGKVVFTGNFESPIVNKDDFIYRELEDILAKLKLSFDNKGNPESDWKD